MAAKQTESGILYGPCGFNALYFQVPGRDRRSFPNGVFGKRLHDYLKKYLPRVDHLYCGYDGDRRWIQVEGLDRRQDREELGIAGVEIVDELDRHSWAYENPRYQGDDSDVNAGGGWIPRWGVCDDPEQLLLIVETFLTTGAPWEGCRWRSCREER